jgi:hypothetical protein
LALPLALWEGRAARAVLVALISLNLAQWLRVATRHLSGEGDLGWNGLWGSVFLAFLPKIPEAIISLLQTPWSRIAVLSQPGASPLQVRADPFALLLTLFVLWAVLMVLLFDVASRRLSASSPATGNSRDAERV